ncbi:MAG TPA: GAF domain-containing protein, partial [Flavisolibacter sp.]|nr:GAF domain-containing protein [Flavisolibacter sp.]
MTITTSNIFNSVFSINPLVQVLKKMIGESKPGAKLLYGPLLASLEQTPDLLAAIDDETLLKQHEELLETVLSTIFPPSSNANQGMYAVCFPFRSETVFASPSFREQFLEEGSNAITVADNKTNYTIVKATSSLAYNLILRKLYSWDVPAVASSVHHFTDAETGLIKYLELKLNAQFVEVKLRNKEFVLPTSYTVQRAMDMDELRKTFPIENFVFEGFVVIDVADVTTEQAVSEIKNTLLNINSFADVTVYDKLQEHIQTFLGLKDVTVGITPFFKINNYYLFSDLHYRNSLLFRNERVVEHKFTTTRLTQKIYRHTEQPQLYANLESASHTNELLPYYAEQGLKSLIICPLKCEDGQLIGLLEIGSTQPGRLRYEHLSKINSAMQLFTMALEKSIEGLELQIDKTIKEHFTAIQPAVEWKFTEAAFDYLQHRQENDLAKLPSITFDNVYPLYAAIDVKNSSVERNKAIHLDLLEQLNMVYNVLQQVSTSIDLPLLKEIQYKVDKYIAATTENLLSEDELQIYEFLQHHIDALFRHLQTARPELKEVVDEYFSALDPQKQILYHHRKKYEDSITKINDTLDRFMDREQASAQAAYPHYFERYITDGIEFNIYIGQSLAPHFPFDELYVSNLKMWQLTVLLKAARITHALEKKLALPLRTTQLILAHSIPLSISFRNKERKFDVDGAYNIRYEIVKKRIDKVHTRDTNERLTQPGKIAIVYSQQK